MMGVILFSITLICTIVIAFSLFVVESFDILSTEMFVAFVNVWSVLGLTFAYFYFAEWMTNDLLGIGDMFFNVAWYRLPLKQQQLYAMPILRAERVLRLTGLGLFDCSLMTFSTVN